jgi:hypothetical protein
MAEGHDRGSCADRATRRIDRQTTASYPPHLRRGINDETRSVRQVQDPFLKISLGIRIAVFLGIVMLMTAKPELWQFDRHGGVFCSSWSLIVSIGVAPD